jgi:hypothetical protein
MKTVPLMMMMMMIMIIIIIIIIIIIMTLFLPQATGSPVTTVQTVAAGM